MNVYITLLQPWADKSVMKNVEGYLARLRFYKPSYSVAKKLSCHMKFNHVFLFWSGYMANKQGLVRNQCNYFK